MSDFRRLALGFTVSFSTSWRIFGDFVLRHSPLSGRREHHAELA